MWEVGTARERSSKQNRQASVMDWIERLTARRRSRDSLPVFWLGRQGSWWCPLAKTDSTRRERFQEERTSSTSDLWKGCLCDIGVQLRADSQKRSSQERRSKPQGYTAVISRQGFCRARERRRAGGKRRLRMECGRTLMF